MTWRKRAQRVVELASWGVGVYLLVAMVLTPWILVALLAFAGLWWLWDRLDREPEPEPPVSVEEVLIRQQRADDRFALVVAAIVFAVFAVLILTSCARPRHPPDYQPPPMVVASLTAFPRVTIAYRPVTLTARLVDPAGVVACPRITWFWPNGTTSSALIDCDPGDATTGHSDVRRGVLPAGEHHFVVTFDSEGRAWSAETTVEVK